MSLSKCHSRVYVDFEGALNWCCEGTCKGINVAALLFLLNLYWLFSVQSKNKLKLPVVGFTSLQLVMFSKHIPLEGQELQG